MRSPLHQIEASLAKLGVDAAVYHHSLVDRPPLHQIEASLAKSGVDPAVYHHALVDRAEVI